MGGVQRRVFLFGGAPGCPFAAELVLEKVEHLEGLYPLDYLGEQPRILRDDAAFPRHPANFEQHFSINDPGLADPPDAVCHIEGPLGDDHQLPPVLPAYDQLLLGQNLDHALFEYMYFVQSMKGGDGQPDILAVRKAPEQHFVVGFAAYHLPVQDLSDPENMAH
jgi:hypothetical protein